MEKLPENGALEIEDFQSFLLKSKIVFNDLWKEKMSQSGTVTDFTLIRHLGSGSFGKVILVKYNRQGIQYAMKAMEKQKIVKYGQIEQTRNEKRVLNCINFPFAVHLEFFFIDSSYVYFIIPFVRGGEMFTHLQKLCHFEEHLARFYGAQVILSLEYLHFLDIIYRDLKPENILVDHTGYIKIIDFGSAKVVKRKTCTICGTPEYIAPEIFLNKGYGKSVDWWSLGILLYEMTAGRAPFFHREPMKMYEMVADLKYFMPKSFSPELKDLVTNILQTDLSKRFGNLRNGARDIKEHKWFRPIAWSTILNRKMPPPYIPKEESFSDLEYENRNQDISLNVSKVNLYEKEFQNF